MANGRAHASIRVPMLGDLFALQAKHVKPQHLMMLTVATSPSLPYIDNDHVIFPNNVQQLTLVVRRKGLREPRTKELHEARKAGCYVSVVLDIVRSQKPRRGIDIATDQNRRVEIPDDGLIA